MPARMTTRPPSWRDQAACRGVGPEVMFPSDGVGVIWAKRICAGCPVQAACLAYALAHREDHGVWGGTSERERRAMLRHRRSSAA